MGAGGIGSTELSHTAPPTRFYNATHVSLHPTTLTRRFCRVETHHLSLRMVSQGLTLAVVAGVGAATEVSVYASALGKEPGHFTTRTT